MAERLDSIVQIDGENYEVIAEEAKKLANKLTIKTTNKDGSTSSEDFDGSEPKTITIPAGVGGEADSAATADEIQVTMDNEVKVYANISIKTTDPTGGKIGDLWFKYTK